MITNNPEPLKGSIARSGRRKPKRNDTDRVCEKEGCETRLTAYNNGSFCYTHAPAHFRKFVGG